MADMTIKHREPLIHIAKRDDMPGWQAWLIRICAILLGLLLSGFLSSALTGASILDVYPIMFKGVFGRLLEGKTTLLWRFLQQTAILLCLSLAVTPAFRMRFWNCGAEGQALIGGLAAMVCMIEIGDAVPNGVLLLIILVCSVLAGAVWGLIPALFHAQYRTNETLFTLMMNYVAIQLVAYFIILWEVPKGSGKVGIINQTTQAGWLPYIGTNSYILVIIFVAIITAGMYIYLKYSKHGYEISVVGESQRTASYVGIKVDKVIIRTLLLSGAICGFTGWMMVSGVDHTITTTLAGGRGFLGIMVSWLAQFNVIAMIFASLLIVFLGQGAGEISTNFGLNESFADIITGIILFFIIGCEFFINYKVHVRKKSGKEEA